MCFIECGNRKLILQRKLQLNDMAKISLPNMFNFLVVPRELVFFALSISDHFMVVLAHLCRACKHLCLLVNLVSLPLMG